MDIIIAKNKYGVKRTVTTNFFAESCGIVYSQMNDSIYQRFLNYQRDGHPMNTSDIHLYFDIIPDKVADLLDFFYDTHVS